MKHAEALKLIGGLSKTSKMPGASWSTSAFECKTGSKLREVENSTCSKCYACKGTYRFPVVKNALKRRLDSITDPRWVEAFVIVLRKLKNTKQHTWFRWHDSGDIQSVDHLKKINEIAKQTPELTHWIPTREHKMVSDFLKDNKKADNLVIRMSAVMIGEGFKKKPLGLPYSTVGYEGPEVLQCPAYSQGGVCGDCRACWDPTKNVNYPQH